MTKVWIVIGVMAVLVVLVASYKVFGIDKVQSWLLWAVTQAEGEFGSGTGKLKLAMVYDLFIAKFPKLQAVIPYKLFSQLVDKSLDAMRDMLKNQKISECINKKE